MARRLAERVAYIARVTAAEVADLESNQRINATLASMGKQLYLALMVLAILVLTMAVALLALR
jgi:hypothetical protein